MRVLPRVHCVLFFWVCGLCSTSLAAAQDLSSVPAHIALVDGRASLEREGRLDEASSGVPFIAGDRLRTTIGRAEIIFPDGSVLDIDEFSALDLQDISLLRLTSGRILLTVAGADNPQSAVQFQVDTPAGSATTSGPGEYRISLLSSPGNDQVQLAVTRGTAFLATEHGTTTVRAGEMSLSRAFEIPSFPQPFNSARFDAFDQWADGRRGERLGTTVSAQYLPPELQMYAGGLDRSGSWQYDASYGYVWFPTVAAGWRPYYDGYWSSIRPYGWTWIGGGAWAWPTHHYGRWGYTRARWFWIPGNRWSPAWVSWGSAQGFVGWCPLGFDNRPVFALSAAFGNSSAGWVAVPRTYFGLRATYVRHHALPPQRLRAMTFIARPKSPVEPFDNTHYAVPRRRTSPADRSTGFGNGGARRSTLMRQPLARPGASRATPGRRALQREATAPGVGSTRAAVARDPRGGNGSGSPNDRQLPQARSRSRTQDPTAPPNATRLPRSERRPSARSAPMTRSSSDGASRAIRRRPGTVPTPDMSGSPGRNGSRRDRIPASPSRPSQSSSPAVRGHAESRQPSRSAPAGRASSQSRSAQPRSPAGRGSGSRAGVTRGSGGHGSSSGSGRMPKARRRP